MIIRQFEMLFFHVPRTAGTTIELMFDPVPRDPSRFYPDIIFGFDRGRYTQHLDYRGMHEYVPRELIERYFKFAFFRNTWDRLRSAYAYLKPHYDRKFGSFEGTVRHACTSISSGLSPLGGHFGRQTEYLFKNGVSGELALDFIGRFEDFEDDFYRLCAMRNLRTKVPLLRTNASREPGGDFRRYFSDELAELVFVTYQPEIEFFRYSF